MNSDPHADQPIVTAGPAPTDANAVLVMIHGRGASAQSILALHRELKIKKVAAIAPQAAGNTWYPQSFLMPLEVNQPYLDSALTRIESIVAGLKKSGISSEKIALLGFSQGACLTSEFIARHPRKYGAVMVLTGGLIGPDTTSRNYAGALDKAPVFLGVNVPDAHVPVERVELTQTVLIRMGANVQVRKYPGMPHTVNEDELEVCRAMIKAI